VAGEQSQCPVDNLCASPGSPARTRTPQHSTHGMLPVRAGTRSSRGGPPGPGRDLWMAGALSAKPRSSGRSAPGTHVKRRPTAVPQPVHVIAWYVLRRSRAPSARGYG